MRLSKAAFIFSIGFLEFGPFFGRGLCLDQKNKSGNRSGSLFGEKCICLREGRDRALQMCVCIPELSCEKMKQMQKTPYFPI